MTAVVDHPRGRIRQFFADHPRVLDALVVAGFALSLLLSAPLEVMPTTFWLLAAAAAVVLFLRRGAPKISLLATLLATCLAVFATGSTSGLEVALAITVYLVATRDSGAVAWGAAAAAIAISCLVVWFFGEADVTVYSGYDIGTDPLDLRIASLVLIPLYVLFALAIGTSIRNRRVRLQHLVDRANQLELERDQGNQLAVADERARIAREMHDVVAHSVQVMIALSDGARALLEKDPARAGSALDELSGTGRSALADMRRILGVLRADSSDIEFEPQPGDLDLGGLLSRYRTAGLPVTYTYSGQALPDDAALQLTVFRIVQESLTNVLRYAPNAATIDVVVTNCGSAVEIIVTNDSPPSSPPPFPTYARPAEAAPRGRGLIGMRERVSAYHGRVTAGPFDGGWRVHAILDLAPVSASARE